MSTSTHLTRGADIDLVDLVATTVADCPSVARLSGGTAGEVATYLPGRRVRGVVFRDTDRGPAVDVHVVGRFGPTVQEISREVYQAVRSVLPRHQVLISIDDLDQPGGR